MNNPQYVDYSSQSQETTEIAIKFIIHNEISDVRDGVQNFVYETLTMAGKQPH